MQRPGLCVLSYLIMRQSDGKLTNSDLDSCSVSDVSSFKYENEDHRQFKNVDVVTEEEWLVCWCNTL